MPNYNTQGITSTDANDPRNTSTSTSSGIMSSTSNPTDNDDNEPSFFESIANFFSGAGADLPSSTTDDDGDSGASFYDSPMFDPYDGGSDNDTTTANDITAAVDSALYEALEIDVPEVYTGMMGEEEPEPNIDMDVLQKALQPDPITVTELEVKAGDTLSGIAKDSGVSVQAIIDANPQIKNPDMIRPGETVSVPDPRFEGVPKPRGIPDSPRLSDLTVTPTGTTTEPMSEPAGLMSPPEQDTAPEIDTGTAEPSTPADSSAEEEVADTSTAFATVIKKGISTEVSETTSLTAGFDSLTETEGTDIHLDGRGFVTLPYGIVPDKNSVKKSDGTVFDPTGSHGLKASSLSGVDYSGATKFGISRTDYDSDQSFAKAVYAEFGSKTAEKYGDGFDDLTDEAKQAAYDMAWNAGTGSAGWSSVKTMLDEASKDGEKSTESLIGFTTNFKSGTGYPRGLLKRRLETYNLVANENEEASTITTTASMSNGVRTGTVYTIKTTDGTVLKSWTKPSTSEVLGDLTVPQ